jgi:hypothetical protein
MAIPLSIPLTFRISFNSLFSIPVNVIDAGIYITVTFEVDAEIAIDHFVFDLNHANRLKFELKVPEFLLTLGGSPQANLLVTWSIKCDLEITVKAAVGVYVSIGVYVDLWIFELSWDIKTWYIPVITLSLFTFDWDITNLVDKLDIYTWNDNWREHSVHIIVARFYWRWPDINHDMNAIVVPQPGTWHTFVPLPHTSLGWKLLVEGYILVAYFSKFMHSWRLRW